MFAPLECSRYSKVEDRSYHCDGKYFDQLFLLAFFSLFWFPHYGDFTFSLFYKLRIGNLSMKRNHKLLKKGGEEIELGKHRNLNIW